MPRKKPAQTDALIRKELAELMPVFARAAVGDFSRDVAVPDDAGPFDELYAGVQIMLDVIRRQLDDQLTVNREYRKAKEETEALLSSIGEGVVALDAAGRVMFINRTAERLVGWPAAKAMDETWHALVPALDLEDGSVIKLEKRAHRLAFASRRRITQAVQYVRRDKGRFPVMVTATPITLRGRKWGVIQIFRDMTKELESQRGAVEYISLAAHQMRSPLTVIRWAAESLLGGDEGLLTPGQLTQMKEIHDADLRMITLVGAFLNVSRLELGSFAVAPSPTDLRTVLDIVARELSAEATRANVAFKRTYPEALPLIDADPRLLHVVFHNLATNALKYNRRGGEIRIGIEAHPREIVVSVSDDGLGISAADRPKIFSKLFRAEAVQLRNIDGTGLGLYIVKTILEKTGGRVWFESEEGKGSTFRVAIPLRGMRQQYGVKELNTTS
ncbi:MAG TPA: HAMP domain-containing sensor histidine kinase [Candidatus Baltobacteraceae bacterium]|nr:HAMP domain-containing sensor histidine kinase [Candidatus Baltobacteraceae bacterium]